MKCPSLEGKQSLMCDLQAQVIKGQTMILPQGTRLDRRIAKPLETSVTLTQEPRRKTTNEKTICILYTQTL